MNRYNIIILESAIQDLSDLSNTISYVYKSPLTSAKYMRGLKAEIAKLKTSAETFSIQTRKSLIQYGFNVRRLNYKKMTIIYVVVDNTVYIQRVLSASTISGL